MIPGKHMCVDSESICIYESWYSTTEILEETYDDSEHLLKVEKWIERNDISYLTIEQKYTKGSDMDEYMISDAQVASFILEFL